MNIVSNIYTKNDVSMLEYLINSLTNNIVDVTNIRKLRELGLFYYNRKNYLLMKLHFQIASAYGCIDSAYYLGLFYQQEKNYSSMKVFYEFAIRSNDTLSMYQLASYYYSIEKNFTLMKKYYNMAINLGHTKSMYDLGRYYKYCEQNYSKAEEYFFLALSNGFERAANEITWMLE